LPVSQVCIHHLRSELAYGKTFSLLSLLLRRLHLFFFTAVVTDVVVVVDASEAAPVKCVLCLPVSSVCMTARCTPELADRDLTAAAVP